MAANPLPLLALAGAAFFLLKRKDEPKAEDTGNLPSPNGNGSTGNGGDAPSDAPSNEPSGDDDHPGWSEYSEIATVIDERAFDDLDGTNAIEFRPNKEGDAVLITNIDHAWSYEMRFPASWQGPATDFGEIQYHDDHILWVSTVGARPIEELKLEGVPDPSKPSERVLLAWM